MIKEKAHHEVRASEGRALVFQTESAINQVTKACSRNPSYNPIGKAEVESNVEDAPRG